MVAAALLTALAVATPASAPVCAPLPEPTPAIERYMAQRAMFGFRHDRAYVRELIRRGVWEYDVGYIPVTPAENRYLRLRDKLQLGPRVSRYLRRHSGLSAGLSVEDDWPREPYLLLRLTADPDRYRAALERRAAYPHNLRLKRVAHSTRDLERVQNRISDDSDALERLGLHWTSVGVDMDHNDVLVEVITTRNDAAAVFRRRYGPAVRVKVIARTLTSPECTDVYGYRPGPDPDSLFVSYESGGGARFDHAVVQETADAVTVAIVVQAPNGPRTADSAIASQLITLAGPLGNRKVIDRRTGKPLKVYEGPQVATGP